jgi:SAM-dependent methyltransferase
MNIVNCTNCGGESKFIFNATDVNRRITNEIFSYRKCLSCSLIFLTNVPLNLDKYYPDEYYPIPSIKRINKLSKKNQYQVDMITEFAPKKGRMLEIGSSYGVFANQAKKSGYIVDSIEMSKICCEYLSNEIGIITYQSDTPQDIIPKLEFNYDVVALWHNIEHLLNPWVVIERAVEKITPGGVLLIATPNPDSIAFRMLGALWPHVDAPRHINLIPERLLTTKLKGLGFDLVIKTSNDKGGKSWNRFTWQRILMNSIPWYRLEKIFFILGWFISIPMSLLEHRKLNGSCYTVIYQKIK